MPYDYEHSRLEQEIEATRRKQRMNHESDREYHEILWEQIKELRRRIEALEGEVAKWKSSKK